VEHARTFPAFGIPEVVKFLLELVAFATLAAWGFIAWPAPLNIVIGILTPVVAILLWALFVSPKAVIRIDTFGRAIVEIIVMAAAALAWWDLGHPVIALVFAVVATAIGIITGRKELA